MYNVIIVDDEKRNRAYYYSYSDTISGNIVVSDLPAFQDIHKARACYYEADEWIFDEDKYNEIIEEYEAQKEADEQARLEAESTPTNLELMLAIMEIAQNQSDLEDAIIELAGLIGGEN